MTQYITIEVNDWNGKKDIGLDAYVNAFTDQTRELYHVLDHKADTAVDDWNQIKGFEDWLKAKAVAKFMSLWTAQNSDKT